MLPVRWLLGSLVALPLAAQRDLYVVQGSVPGGQLGAAVAGVGDVDADGVDDFAFGMGTIQTVASVEVRSGSGGHVLWSWSDGRVGTQFGRALAAAGDVDADGYDDVVIGVPGGLTAEPGRALVMSGRTGLVLWTLSSGATGVDRFGAAVDAAGDVDGDGFDDVIVGAPEDGIGGVARVFSGRDGTVLRTFATATADLQFGSAVAGLGDVDGDGVDDVAVGAPGFFLTLAAGSVRVYSGADGSELLALASSVMTYTGFGASVARVGDVDSDGHADLLIGESGNLGGGVNAGRAALHSGATGALLFERFGVASNDLFGASVAGLGDVDGDGTADFAVGQPGAVLLPRASAVFVFSGADYRELRRIAGPPPTSLLGSMFGSALASAGDTNGDGLADVIVGAPQIDVQLGRVQVIDLGFVATPSRELISGAGCNADPTRRPRIGASRRAFVGRTLDITLRGANLAAQSATLLLGDPTDLPLDLLGLVGCTLYVQPWITPTAATSGGRAHYPFQIPATPALIGRRFDAQWIAPEQPAVSPLPLTFSDTLRVTIGG